MQHSWTTDAQVEAAAWENLIGELQEAIDPLVESFVHRVTEIPGYQDDAVSAGELRVTAADSLRLVVSALADANEYAKVARYARELGERRATQGVPAEALTSAVRLNFPVIWDKLTELAGPKLQLHVSRVGEIWDLLDSYAVGCYLSYMDTRVREARTEARVQQEFVSTLFSADGQSPEVQSRFGHVFKTPVDGSYGVFAVNGSPPASMRAAGRAPAHFIHETGVHSFLFWSFSPSEGSILAHLPGELRETPGGFEVTHKGLAGISEAATNAATLAEHLTSSDSSPLTIDTAWARLSRNLLIQSGFRLDEKLNSMLQNARNVDEQERIRETVEIFLETGSASETGARLFTHRNTVLNRLRRFTELTGYDLRIPEEAALVVVSWRT